MEEDYTANENITVTRYGIGARGVDYIKRGSTVGFPIYDGHGNMIATIGRSGSSYALGDQRTYDVWGEIRSANKTGDPKFRYCANLGHQGDDESGLIYMRARYYEPSTGRFVSEDPGKHGSNWSSYARNDPVNHADATGKEWTSYLMEIYKSLKRAIALFDSASANPRLVEKNIQVIRELMKDITRIGRTADILGENMIEAGYMTTEDSRAMGGFAEHGIELGMDEMAAGGGTISVKAVAALVIRELELILTQMGG